MLPAAQGVRVPRVAQIHCCSSKCPGTHPSSSGVLVPLRLPKSTRFSLSPGHWLQGYAHRSYCPVSLVFSNPRIRCVCALVWVARTRCLAVLGSLSLSALTPLHQPGAGLRGAQVPPGCGLYLTPFMMCWVLQLWM